ncbi:MAG: amino acid ABC transporter substrate-binding protein [Alphaproteobacteria bacterium]|nr:amino acid ABC transporter substrate-binding protein [Alphaproteobacteria bacterium]
MIVRLFFVAAFAICSVTSLAAEDAPLIVGAVLSETGKFSTNGKHAGIGYDLAVQRINALGGVRVGDRTHRLEIAYYDDESTPVRGAALAERLIKQDGVKFMLGPYSSALTQAIAPITEAYSIPMVEGNGSARSLFTQGYRYLFAVLSTSEEYFSSAIDLLADLAESGGRAPSSVRIALATENDPASQDVRAGVLTDAARYGMEIVIDDKLPPDVNDMTAILTKVKALRPDALLVSGHSRGATIAVRQVAEMRVAVPALIVTHCDAADIIGKFGGDAEDVICPAQWDRSLPYSGRWFGGAEDYAVAFERAFGYAPPYQAAESSAAVLTLVDAIERAGSLDGGAVRDALAATDLATFFGRIRFDASGKNIAKPMVLYQVQDGVFRVVAPAEWASAKPVFPR